jgi:intracellular multiplication protein IcmS
MSAVISEKMVAIAKTIGSSFTFKDQPIAAQEVFSSTGLLPGLAKRADDLCALCFGYNLGTIYEDDQDALLGSSVRFDEFTPDIMRLLCLTDSLYEIIRTAPSQDSISLDELMYD